MRDPFIVLGNISAYAAPACRLLLWTDLGHDGGLEGHRDVTGDRAGFRRLIEQLGFAIASETPHRQEDPTVQFGCRAVKVERADAMMRRSFGLATVT